MNRGIIAWFTENRVAANLLMMCILVAGTLSALHIRKEFFPEYSTGTIEITMTYPGAAPEEVEEGVCVKIEEAIRDIDGIRKIRSEAYEGLAMIFVEIRNGYNENDILDRMRDRIDAISTFPEDSKKPVIVKQTTRQEVLWLVVAGDTDERALKNLAREIKQELADRHGITQVDILGARDFEISIEVSETALRQYGLTLEDVAVAVQRSSLNIPAGAIKTTGGEILLRTGSKAYKEQDFRNIILLTGKDGIRITLGQVADITDGFEDSNRFLKFQGKNCTGLQIFRVGDQSTLEVAEAVKTYVARKSEELPRGITLVPVADTSEMLADRLTLMIRNLFSGGLLVFFSLALFLRIRLAFWVMAGIPVCFLGTLWIMPFMDISVNMISLFGFILVLGIVVDDAIVIGENVFTVMEEEGPGVNSVVKGAGQVAVSATFGVLTTVAAFTPLLMIPGVNGKIWSGIALVVILCLFFSLLESKLILPAHLAHMKTAPDKGLVFRIQKATDMGLQWFIQRIYRPFLEISIRNRYTTLAFFVAIAIITAGMVKTGIVRFVFFPDIEADNIEAALIMPPGTPVADLYAAVAHVEQAAQAVNREIREEFSLSVDIVRNQVSYSMSENNAQFYVELMPGRERPVSSAEIIRRWRKKTGRIPGVTSLEFSGSTADSGHALAFELGGQDFGKVRAAGEMLKAKMARYPDVHDIKDTISHGKQEIKLQIKPGAHILGLAMNDLAGQVRRGFHGAEVQTIQRGMDEVKVMVRYPKSGRSSLSDLENMRMRTPEGEAVPFSAVAEASLAQGFSEIRRTDGKRVISVFADIDKKNSDPGKIIEDICQDFIPDLEKKYPGVTCSLDGEAREEKESLMKLANGAILGLFLIYALMAIPLKSYIQPLLIMSAIPFGIVGAIFGHLVMGMPVSILSLCGIIALAGVVVNDSLVMVDFVNAARNRGLPLGEAVIQSGTARFRAIMLTSLTTFFGLLPMLTEKSLQARFLIPMTTSLAFGIVFSTVITLILIPALYMAGADIKTLFSMKKNDPVMSAGEADHILKYNKKEMLQ